MGERTVDQADYEAKIAAYEAYVKDRDEDRGRRFADLDALRPDAIEVLREALSVRINEDSVAAAAAIIEHTQEVPWNGPEFPAPPPSADIPTEGE